MSIDITKLKAASEYKKLSSTRENYITRAKDASKLTIPQLYPETEDTESTWVCNH